MVEAVWSETNRLSPYIPTSSGNGSLYPPSTLYTSNSNVSRPLSLVSPSVGRRVKGQRSVNGKQ